MSGNEFSIDPALDLLVSTINQIPEHQSDGIGVTLTVHGLIISGRVIPHWQWFEDVEQLCREARLASGDLGDAGDDPWAFLFKSFKDGLIELRSDRKAVDAVIEDLPQRHRNALLKVDSTAYIHLRDARAFPGGTSSIPTIGGLGAYWRGRLADVSGWTFGVLTVGSSS